MSWRNPGSERRRKHGRPGWFGDVEGMARAAIELLEDEKRLRTMGKRARIAAQSRFCVPKIIPECETFYAKIVESAQ